MPNLVKLGLENFKAFGNYQEIPLNGLTLVSGLNSTGKSSIYQVILLIYQSFRKGNLSSLRLNEDYITLGSTDEIFHDCKKGTIRFYLEWGDKTSVELKYSNKPDVYGLKKQESPFLVGLKFEGSPSLDSRFFSYEISRVENNSWSVRANNTLAFSSLFNRLLEKHVEDNYQLQESSSIKEKIYKDEVLFEKIKDDDIKIYDFLKEFSISFEDFFNCIKEKYHRYIHIDELKQAYELKVKEMLSFEDPQTVTKLISRLTLTNDNYEAHNRYFWNLSSNFMPPFRGTPKRVYLEGDKSHPLPKYNSIKGRTITYGFDFQKRKPRTGKLEDALKYWVEKHFLLANKIQVKEPIENYATEVVLTTVSGKGISIINVGFGTSQILPIIFTMLSEAGGASLFVIDEPEIHLHPSLQAKLAEFFLEMSHIGKRMFIETHSEYLINRIIFLTVKHGLDTEKTNLFWIKNPEGHAIAESIKYDDFGFVTNQPDGFLDNNANIVQDFTALRLEKLDKNE